MRIIDYFKQLKERILLRRKVREESKDKFYSKCKQGIFLFFRPYLTEQGFYLELENKQGLKEYISKIKSGKTIENKLSNYSSIKPLYSPEFQNRINDSIKPIYDVFDRLINYFKKYDKKNLEKYSSLSFDYNPKFKGYQTYSKNNKLEFNFG